MSAENFAYWWIDDIFLGEMNPRPEGFATSDQDEFDVIVVGSGMAGFTAAILSHDAGNSVLMLEAADEVGGTTYKSGAGMWVPNNHVMNQMGVVDDRDTVLRYMARIAYPGQFDPDAEHYGVGAWEWEKLTTYYDNAATAIRAVVDAGALKVMFFPSFTERYPAMASYHYELDNSIQGYYRHLMPMKADGHAGIGHEMIAQVAEAAKQREIELHTGHRASGLIHGSDGAVIGVTVDSADGEKALYARRGVVFCTGGFPHSAEFVDQYFRGPLYSSCAVATAQGDFIRIGLEEGAELAHMRNGWFYEDLLEKAAPDRVAMEGGINVPSGDSMIYVDLTGRRFVNEKTLYQERATSHWEQAADGSFPHRVTFMIFDDFVAKDTRPWLFLDTFQAPKPWIIEGATLQELEANIQERLAGLDHITGGLRLEPGFTTELGTTLERFNGFARAGKDEDFHRGEQMNEYDWHGPARDGHHGNPTMYPFAADTRYYCVLICGMVLDLNGGPKTNANSQVMRADGTVIEGLYGSGNCVANVSGEGYLSGGSTLGPATTFSYLAAKHLSGVPRRDVTASRAAAV
jgi:succinate dehydrogenase/fumarate reductase flavoprotein subunit